MSNKNHYLVQFNGKARLIESKGVGDIRAFLLNECGFKAKRATGAEVVAHFAAGGKPETADPQTEIEAD